MHADRYADQAAQHVVIAADIPARLQAYPVMNLADGLDPSEIRRIEAAGEQALPMRGLRLLQLRDAVADQLAKLRHRDGVLVEPVEYARQFRFDMRPE